MARNHGYSDEELDIADAEMAATDERLMSVRGHLAPDEMPAPIVLSAVEHKRGLAIVESPPRPTAALVALLRRRPTTSAVEER